MLNGTPKFSYGKKIFEPVLKDSKIHYMDSNPDLDTEEMVQMSEESYEKKESIVILHGEENLESQTNSPSKSDGIHFATPQSTCTIREVFLNLTPHDLGINRCKSGN